MIAPYFFFFTFGEPPVPQEPRRVVARCIVEPIAAVSRTEPASVHARVEPVLEPAERV